MPRCLCRPLRLHRKRRRKIIQPCDRNSPCPGTPRQNIELPLRAAVPPSPRLPSNPETPAHPRLSRNSSAAPQNQYQNPVLNLQPNRPPLLRSERFPPARPTTILPILFFPAE